MLKEYLTIFDDSKLAMINDAVFAILKNIGLRVENDTILKILSQKGSRVDYNHQVAKFPSKTVEKIIKIHQKKVRKKEEKENKKELNCFEETKPWLESHHFFLYDWDKKEKRRATEKDYTDMIHLAEVMGFDVSPPVLNPKFDPILEPLESLAVLIEHTSRPGIVAITKPEIIKYLAEIGEIYGGPEGKCRFIHNAEFIVSPLTMNKKVAACILEKAKYNAPVGIGTMPMSGSTAPVTMAGVVTLATAEIIAGWIVVNSVNENTEISGCIASGMMDMTTTRTCLSTPETMLQDMGVHQLFRRLYGCYLEVPWFVVDAKVPGLQASYEKCFKVFALESLRIGHFTGFGLGSLDGGTTFSPTQAMVELDLVRGIWQLFHGIKVTNETIALDIIERVGIGGNYMENEHTARHFRDEMWFPAILDRTFWENTQEELEKERNILKKADEKWRELLNKYEPPEVDRKMLKEIHRVVEKAREELTKGQA